jgi:cephalosporin hydroxylase
MNFNEEITKKEDMINNDGLSSYLGMDAQQKHKAYEVFYNFLNEVKPKRILEIGTALGGFTRFLKKVSDESNLGINILTYDINRMNWYDDLINEGIDVRVEDIFSDNYSAVNQEVINYIQQDGLTIVLCDGGNKVGEFNILSNYIKRGDFIMAHDYVYNREDFTENYDKKIWNWHEIEHSYIAEACDRNNLQSYKSEIFNNVVWVCKIKN